MLGILPVWTRMLAKRKALGYVEVRLNAATLLGAAGDHLRGHEFHYSEVIEASTPDRGWQPAYETRYRRQREMVLAGFQRGRILASYAHIHFGSHPKVAESIVQFAAGRDRL
jgi:cobyrinic acid a,c-diamide synthase